MKSIVYHIGIDCHQETSVIDIIRNPKDRVLHTHIQSERKALYGALDRYRQEGARVVMESGGMCFDFYRVLTERYPDWEILIVPAQNVKVIVQSRNKRDSVDARALSELSWSGYLPREVYVPDDWVLKLRELQTARKLFVRQRTQLINAVKSLERKYRLSSEMPESTKIIIRQYAGQIGQVTKEIGKLDDSISNVISQHAERAYQTLVKIPTIGPVSAVAVIAAIGDFRRFRRREEVANYFGLVPREHSSGDVIKQLGITKEGAPLARSVLIQGTQHLSRATTNHAFKRLYDDLVARGKHTNVAKVAVARKAVELGWTLITRHEEYRPQVAA